MAEFDIPDYNNLLGDKANEFSYEFEHNSPFRKKKPIDRFKLTINLDISYKEKVNKIIKKRPDFITRSIIDSINTYKD
jgi:hypothetical protein